VYSARLEHWGGVLAACSIETVAAHWVEVLAVEVSAFGSSGAAPRSLVAASGMEDVDHASTGEPCSGF
jgi:hypothetical protein